MKKSYYIKTYGCQMNELDSQHVGRMLKAQGFAPTVQPEEADVILINTCSIREKASQKVYSDVGRFRSLKLQRPEVVLGVAGCQAQAEGRHLQKRFPYLDLVVGPDHLAKIPALVDELMLERQKAASQNTSRQTKATQVGFEKREDYQFLNLLPDEEENQVKAFVNIMKGCDNFCSFCIVPQVRGREVCREPDEIVTEVQQLAEQGVKEVMLLGQNVNSYGVGRHSLEMANSKRGPSVISFAKLIRRLLAETEVARIRFTTSHPKDLPDELIQVFADEPERVARQFHLPVQSGSDAVLERMYRGYTRAQYLERLDAFRQVDPNIAFSTDIIVGFPGETEEDFEATLSLLREVEFDSIYSFNYSPRPRTTAALYFEDDVELSVKKERLHRLQALQDEITHRKNQERLGQVLQVLVEGNSKQGYTYCGRSSQNHQVHFEGEESDVGQIVPIKITRGGPNSLLGEKNV